MAGIAREDCGVDNRERTHFRLDPIDTRVDLGVQIICHGKPLLFQHWPVPEKNYQEQTQLSSRRIRSNMVLARNMKAAESRMSAVGTNNIGRVAASNRMIRSRAS